MGYDVLNIMVPTRGRPKWILRFIESALDCCDSKKQIRFTFLVDADDAESCAALNRYSRRKYVAVLTNTWGGPHPHLPKYYNQMYRETPFCEPGVAVSMFGDDMVFESSGYDTAFLSALSDANGYAVVYGDDCYIQHDKMCVHLVTSRELVAATQRPFMCELFRAQCIDTVWYAVGKARQLLRYLPDVKVHHYHSGALPAESRDETFKRLQQATPSYVGRRGPLTRHVEFVVERLKAKGIGR